MKQKSNDESETKHDLTHNRESQRKSGLNKKVIISISSHGNELHVYVSCVPVQRWLYNCVSLSHFSLLLVFTLKIKYQP